MTATTNRCGPFDHLCSVCELIHETIPACEGCADYLENQTWWMEAGRVQGYWMADQQFQTEREKLLDELSRLGADISGRIVRRAVGPTFPELCDRRNEPQRGKPHARIHREIVERLMGVNDAHRHA